MIYYEYSGVFKAINSTVDGILSLGELLDMAGRLELFLTEEEGSRIFSLMDIDGDEKVRIVMRLCYFVIYHVILCHIVLCMYTSICMFLTVRLWLFIFMHLTVGRTVLLQSFLSILKYSSHLSDYDKEATLLHIFVSPPLIPITAEAAFPFTFHPNYSLILFSTQSFFYLLFHLVYSIYILISSLFQKVFILLLFSNKKVLSYLILSYLHFLGHGSRFH